MHANAFLRKVLLCAAGFLFPFLSNLEARHTTALIPKTIWQTYKTKSLPKEASILQETWTAKNPGYAYFLWDDADIASYIHKKWDLDTEQFFLALPLGVMKADLWRYLILTTDGGVYSDVDSECCSPADTWGANIKKRSSHALLIGLENDTHFCQWTLAATPHHPAMKHVCKFIVDRWKATGIDTKNPNFVHKSTGPGVWTDALIDYLGISTQKIPAGKEARYVYDRYVQDQKFRKRVNRKGLYLFPKEFYSGQASRNLYGSQNFGDGYIRWIVERDALTG
jgi:inositol phosphorylceramide mannosyltransferase catalytic subunit